MKNLWWIKKRNASRQKILKGTFVFLCSDGFFLKVEEWKERRRNGWGRGSYWDFSSSAIKDGSSWKKFDSDRENFIGRCIKMIGFVQPCLHFIATLWHRPAFYLVFIYTSPRTLSKLKKGTNSNVDEIFCRETVSGKQFQGQFTNFYDDQTFFNIQHSLSFRFYDPILWSSRKSDKFYFFNCEVNNSVIPFLYISSRFLFYKIPFS